jgi:hypothetical protein
LLKGSIPIVRGEKALKTPSLVPASSMSSAWFKRINEDLSHPFHPVWLPSKDQGVSQVESEDELPWLSLL